MKNNNASLFKFLILIAGILAAIMAFFPALVHDGSDSIFKGYELAIGTEFLDLGSIASGQIEPNILIGLAYLLPLLACFLGVFLQKGAIISALLFIVAAVLLVLIPQMTVASVTVLGNTNEIDVEWVMGYGLYIAIGLAVFGALLSIFQVATHSKD
jgi:hypothetical protein